MRHGVSMSLDLIDFNVRETIGLGSEQLATSRDRYPLRVHLVFVFHGRSTSDPQNLKTCPGNMRRSSTPTDRADALDSSRGCGRLADIDHRQQRGADVDG
jgi:hypothetical protein